jgi:futalosine hydrolase
MGEPCDLLVVAAFPPELAGLDPGPDPEGLVVATRVVGVGMLAAAVGAAAAMEAVRPRAVVLTGTCGAYANVRGAALHVNDVVVARTVMLVEPAVEEGRAAFPAMMSRSVDTHEGLRRALVAAGAPVADVATTLAITTDDPLAAVLARCTGAMVEHLEAYGVAVACEARGIPFVAALGVANVVGSSGRAGWLAGHNAATRTVNQLLMQWIGEGGAGIPLVTRPASSRKR